MGATNQSAYTIAEFGKRFSLGRTTVYRLIEDHKIVVRHLGRSVRIFAVDNAEWFLPLAKAA